MRWVFVLLVCVVLASCSLSADSPYNNVYRISERDMTGMVDPTMPPKFEENSLEVLFMIERLKVQEYVLEYTVYELSGGQQSFKEKRREMQSGVRHRMDVARPEIHVMAVQTSITDKHFCTFNGTWSCAEQSNMPPFGLHQITEILEKSYRQESGTFGAYTTQKRSLLGLELECFLIEVRNEEDNKDIELCINNYKMPMYIKIDDRQKAYIEEWAATSYAVEVPRGSFTLPNKWGGRSYV